MTAATQLTYLSLQAHLPTRDLETLKRDRLRELRATIDALRCEQQCRDPLLEWVIAESQRPRQE